MQAWDAVIVHVPGDTYVTSAPDTVHTPVVLDEYDTGKFDDAVADRDTPPGACAPM